MCQYIHCDTKTDPSFSLYATPTKACPAATAVRSRDTLFEDHTGVQSQCCISVMGILSFLHEQPRASSLSSSQWQSLISFINNTQLRWPIDLDELSNASNLFALNSVIMARSSRAIIVRRGQHVKNGRIRKLHTVELINCALFGAMAHGIR